MIHQKYFKSLLVLFQIPVHTVFVACIIIWKYQFLSVMNVSSSHKDCSLYCSTPVSQIMHCHIMHVLTDPIFTYILQHMWHINLMIFCHCCCHCLPLLLLLPVAAAAFLCYCRCLLLPLCPLPLRPCAALYSIALFSCGGLSCLLSWIDSHSRQARQRHQRPKTDMQICALPGAVRRCRAADFRLSIYELLR